MIIIYKNKNSQNKQTLKYLVREQLTKIGLGNLKFQERSQENAEDASPEEIWGNLLRYVQEEEEGSRKGEKKPVTYAAFIKRDVQDRWLNKTYKTINLSNELRMALLMTDANEDTVLSELKMHFAIWGENVMTFLYAAMADAKKKGTTREKRKEPLKIQEFTAEELRREAARKEGDRAVEQQKQKQLEQERQMEIQTAKFNKEMEENKEELDKLYAEVSIITGVLRKTRLQSQRVSAIPSSVVMEQGKD